MEILKWLVIIPDVLYTIFFFFSILLFRIFSAKEIERAEAEKISPSDYSIYCSNMPRNATKEEIHSYFSQFGVISELVLCRPLQKFLTKFKIIEKMKERKVIDEIEAKEEKLTIEEY